MPLIYVPLIMFASWMEFFAQPFKPALQASDLDPLALEPASRRR